MIISPCISICKTDPTTGYCYGCGRNNEEKKTWKLEETTDDWKSNNLKGFRPGKVPKEVLKRQFGKAVFGEVLDKVLKETCHY